MTAVAAVAAAVVVAVVRDEERRTSRGRNERVMNVVWRFFLKKRMTLSRGELEVETVIGSGEDGEEAAAAAGGKKEKGEKKKKPAHHPLLLAVLAEELGCDAHEIVDFELEVCDTQPSVVGGAAREFIYSGRLDNLASSFCALKALIEAGNGGDLAEETGVRMIALFDNEEVGSDSTSGAGYGRALCPLYFHSSRVSFEIELTRLSSHEVIRPSQHAVDSSCRSSDSDGVRGLLKQNSVESRRRRRRPIKAYQRLVVVVCTCAENTRPWRQGHSGCGRREPHHQVFVRRRSGGY